MSDDLETRALDLALFDARPTGDPELDALVSRASMDVAAIRAGLSELAEEIPARPETARAARRPRRRTLLLLGIAAVFAAAGVGGWAASRGGSSGSALAGSRPDRFDYQPAVIGTGVNFPVRPYSVPSLAAVAAWSATDAWIVGSVGWHWDGTRWRPAALPRVHGDWSLASDAAVGPGDAWAVGSWPSAPTDQIVVTHPLVEHWDGTSWHVVPLPTPVAAGLESVSADSATDVWASGWWVPTHTNPHLGTEALRPLVAHWNGHTWRFTHIAEPWPSDLDRIDAVSPDDVWASGSSQSGHAIMLHWDGARWNTVRAPFGPHDPINGLAATSATDVWAVGGRRLNGHARTLAAHWDGHTWMIAPTPNQNTDSVLVDVRAISPTDIWALGQSSFFKKTRNASDCKTPCTEIRSTLPIGIYEHWNGRRWSLAPTTSPQMMLEGSTSLATAPDGSAWAIGGCYWENVITHWDGHSWRAVRHPPDIRYPPQTSSRDRRPGTTGCLSHASSGA